MWDVCPGLVARALASQLENVPSPRQFRPSAAINPSNTQGLVGFVAMGLQDFISCLSVCLLLVRCGIAINIPENSDIHLHSMSTAFDENRMQILAELAGVSYCPTATIEDWSCTYCRNSGLQLEGGLVRVIGKSLVQANATRVVVGKLDGEDNCFLSFRGSSVSSNYVADFTGVQVDPPAHSFPGCEGCSVHAGFLLIWETLEADIKSTLSEYGCGPTSSQGLVVTGHSLGAASAHLAMYALHHAGFRIAEAYTFESPRSGNKAFLHPVFATVPQPHPNVSIVTQSGRRAPLASSTWWLGTCPAGGILFLWRRWSCATSRLR